MMVIPSVSVTDRSAVAGVSVVSLAGLVSVSPIGGDYQENEPIALLACATRRFKHPGSKQRALRSHPTDLSARVRCSCSDKLRIILN